MNTQISTTTFDREKRYSGVYQQRAECCVTPELE